MRILHVYKDYWPVVGGIENHVRRLATGLNRKPDVDVSVLVTNRSRQTVRSTIEGVPVTKTGRIATISSAPVSPGLFWEIGKRRYDVIHLHFPYPIGELAYLLRGRAQRLVVTYHSDIVRQRKLLLVYRPFLEILLRRADAICVSNPNYALGSPFLSRHSGKLSVIHHGLDLERFAETVAIRERARQFRGRFATPVVLFVGELRYYKGVDVLLQAMTSIAGTLVIVGGGPEEPRLRALSAEIGLANRIVFAGRVPDEDLVPHYFAADVFVLPSTLRAESWGSVLLEAMACGLPVISTELGTGTSYVNIDDVTGTVVPPNDPVALATALRGLLSNVDRRASLGAAGRARVASEMTVRRMVDETFALYQRLLA